MSRGPTCGEDASQNEDTPWCDGQLCTHTHAHTRPRTLSVRSDRLGHANGVQNIVALYELERLAVNLMPAKGTL